MKWVCDLVSYLFLALLVISFAYGAVWAMDRQDRIDRQNMPRWDFNVKE